MNINGKKFTVPVAQDVSVEPQCHCQLTAVVVGGAQQLIDGIVLKLKLLVHPDNVIMRAILEDDEIFEFQATQFVVTFFKSVQVVVDKASPSLEDVVSLHIFPQTEMGRAMVPVLLGEELL